MKRPLVINTFLVNNLMNSIERELEIFYLKHPSWIIPDFVIVGVERQIIRKPSTISVEEQYEIIRLFLNSQENSCKAIANKLSLKHAGVGAVITRYLNSKKPLK